MSTHCEVVADSSIQLLFFTSHNSVRQGPSLEAASSHLVNEFFAPYYWTSKNPSLGHIQGQFNSLFLCNLVKRHIFRMSEPPKQSLLFMLSCSHMRVTWSPSIISYRVQNMKLLLHRIPATFSSGRKNLLDILFSSALRMTDRSSHQYETGVKIIILFVLIFQLTTFWIHREQEFPRF